MEASAQYDFVASDPKELSFRRGDILKILNRDEDPHWYKAEMGGIKGFVPSNYIRITECSWYLGKISRIDAEAVLKKPRVMVGNFIVRRSESSPDDFSISVRTRTAIQHFKVLRDKYGKYFIWIHKLNSINELVQYHRFVSVSRTDKLLLRDLQLQIKFAKALFDFNPQTNDELGFKRDDIITIVNRNDPNWWAGTLNNRRGAFPSNYVRLYNNAEHTGHLSFMPIQPRKKVGCLLHGFRLVVNSFKFRP